MNEVSKVRKRLTLDTPAKRAKFESYIRDEMKLVARSALRRWRVRTLVSAFNSISH